MCATAVQGLALARKEGGERSERTGRTCLDGPHSQASEGEAGLGDTTVLLISW